jgi:hypothetical protein
MRKVTVCVSAALLLVALVAARLFFLHINSGLNAIRQQVRSEGDVGFRLIEVDTAGSGRGGLGFELVSSSEHYTTGIDLDGKLYLGGPGGLAIYSGSSQQPTLLRTGMNLPPAPIVALASGRLRGDSAPSVFAATQGEGLLILGDDLSGRCQQLLPNDAEDRDITAVLPLDSGDVLLGTRRAGLLLYDGETLKQFQPNFTKLAITALAGNEGDFWIGTRAQGVLHWHAGELDTIGEAAGMPDQLVNYIVVGAAGVFVGTPLGVAQFSDGHVSRVLGQGLFARSLALDGNTLMVATIDQGMHAFLLSTPSAGRTFSEDQGANVTHFFSADHNLMAIEEQGLLRRREDGSWQKVLSFPPQQLADNDVSALSFSPDGRLWIGLFDHGLDVLDLETNRAEAIEDDHVFCVNRIVPDAQRNTMDVATSNGLVFFDSSQAVPRERQVLLRRDGLISDQITDVAFTRSGLMVATPAGITFLTASGPQSLYAFQGLVNNHVYSLAAQPVSGRVIAGTLGGISILDDGAVRQNVTLRNSGLKRNWITAILRVAQPGELGGEAVPTWMVGTYGGGVVEMDEAGRVTAVDNPAPAAVINPNALLATPQHIFAGTLDDGLLIYNRSSRHWSHITAGLPSRNITAFAEKSGELYIGTANGIVRIAEERMP